MIMSSKNLRVILLLVIGLSAILPSCSTFTNTTRPPATAYSISQLKYLLLDAYPDYFWCDPDYYPIVREGQEQQNAISQFPATQGDQEEFVTILRRLQLPAQNGYSDEEKLAIYREHKKLSFALQIVQAGIDYDFSLRTGQGQGWRYEGAITTSGQISVRTKATSFNTCPICLPQGTLIDTPMGQVPVESLHVGALVWTLDSNGQRVSAPILTLSTTPVPSTWVLVSLTLADGRNLSVSPGHPSVDGQELGAYHAGDRLDGSDVISTDRLAYYAGFTYDILPSGPTGFYWANGIQIASTLK
jgi:hypothetical protein